jgi:putative lipoic acid-binding regulatory protein
VKKDAPQLEFPLSWNGKIIAHDAEDIHSRLQEAVIALGLTETVQRGNVSREGRYVTFNITVEFQDREMMVRVTETLAAVQGVRMVL